MLLELLATVALGLGSAGAVIGIDRLVFKKRLPKWMPSTLAGLAMISCAIHLEYSWQERTTERLPAGVVVAKVYREAMPYRPWTYLRPVARRITALDTRRHRRHVDAPNQVMTTLVLFERWMPTRELPVVFDCLKRLRADLHADVEILITSELRGARWLTLRPDDPALLIACTTR
jgi:hypothetical protein